MTRVTTVILNWKRPDGVKNVIQKLKKQTIVPYIIVFNNNKNCNIKFNCDEQINSSLNFGCMIRWMIMSQVESEYVFSIDDDVDISNNSIIEKCITTIQNLKSKFNCKFPIVCHSGVTSNTSYLESVEKIESKNMCGKGLFMFMEYKLLQNIPFKLEREDDIFISSFSDYIFVCPFVKKHIFLTIFSNDEYALCNEKKHYPSRKMAYDKYILNKPKEITIGILSYEDTVPNGHTNLGDQIQTVAASQFWEEYTYGHNNICFETKGLSKLFSFISHKRKQNKFKRIVQHDKLKYSPKINVCLVNRDNMMVENKHNTPVHVIMAGWFMKGNIWPPPDCIHPIFISFHINNAKAILTPSGITYLKKHEPIG